MRSIYSAGCPYSVMDGLVLVPIPITNSGGENQEARSAERRQKYFSSGRAHDCRTVKVLWIFMGLPNIRYELPHGPPCKNHAALTSALRIA